MERAVAEVRRITSHIIPDELRTEFIRKSIHILVAVVPSIAYLFGVTPTLAILAAGTLLYTYAEGLRMEGQTVAVISRLTSVAARRRDQGRFVMGPVTLGLGAMLALLLYPEPAAIIAIYALAFGDGLASLAGKLFGSVKVPFTGGKTVEGSLTCLLAVFMVTYGVTGRPEESFAIAVFATAIEILPLDDLDNLALPVGAGLMATQLLL